MLLFNAMIYSSMLSHLCQEALITVCWSTSKAKFLKNFFKSFFFSKKNPAELPPEGLVFN